MEIGFVTDEISPDVKEAIEIGVSWGINNYELRVVGEHRIPDITADKIEQIVRLKEKFGIRITALSPGTFKGTLKDSTITEREISETLPETFRLAKMFNADTVIVFGFKRSHEDHADDEQQVVDLFSRVAASAHHHGLVIAVENEPGFWCDSGANTARILAAVNSPALRANWDPGNSVGTDEPPFPDGYRAIKDWIANIHVKDTIRGALVECVPVGEGVVDWPGQLRAIVQDQAVRHVTIETHCLPLIEKSKQNLRVVKELIAAAS
ncbi:MAG: sugar phosphate isomerase/epimerase [Verrucomicrobia bacterium]|nr:sugar phosphate isomerase/epimerase [Verrucomicrobiota bacterium]